MAPTAEATLPRPKSPAKTAKKRRPAASHATRSAPATRGSAPATHPRPRPAAPRRRSGPVAAPRTHRRPVAVVGRVAQQRGSVVLDSLLRGRGWIVLVGVLLAGIVFLNVSVLQLNRGIAATTAQSTALERTNSGLRNRVAQLDSAERIQRVAAQHGFYLPQPGDIGYLRPSARDARVAARQIVAPGSSTQYAVGGTQTAAPQSAVPTPTPAAATTATAPAAAAAPAAAPAATASPTAAPTATASPTAAPTAGHP